VPRGNLERGGYHEIKAEHSSFRCRVQWRSAGCFNHFGPVAFADWQICNRTVKELNVAIGYERGQLKSDGWYQIAPCSCHNVMSGSMHDKSVWYFATGEDGDWEAPPGGETVVFCVNPTSKFDYGDEYNRPGPNNPPGPNSRCERSGNKLHNFYHVHTTGDTHTTNLTPGSGQRSTCF